MHLRVQKVQEDFQFAQKESSCSQMMRKGPWCQMKVLRRGLASVLKQTDGQKHQAATGLQTHSGLAHQAVLKLRRHSEFAHQVVKVPQMHFESDLASKGRQKHFEVRLAAREHQKHFGLMRQMGFAAVPKMTAGQTRLLLARVLKAVRKLLLDAGHQKACCSWSGLALRTAFRCFVVLDSWLIDCNPLPLP